MPNTHPHRIAQQPTQCAGHASRYFILIVLPAILALVCFSGHLFAQAQPDIFTTQWTPLGGGGTATGDGVYRDMTFGIAAADMDNDGDTDVVVANASIYISERDLVLGGQNYIALNDGNGVFDRIVNFGTGNDNSRAVLVRDLDGDSCPDVIVANLRAKGSSSGACVDIYLNAFSSGGSLALHDRVGNEPIADHSYGATSLALGDLNGDGKLDLAVGYRRGSGNSVTQGPGCELWFGDGAGNFSLHTTILSAISVLGVAIADIDGDGHNDIVTTNNNGKVYFNLHGSGDFNGVNAATFTTATTTWTTVQTGDINGDGTVDVVMGDGSAFEFRSFNAPTRAFAANGVFGDYHRAPQSGSLAGLLDYDGDGDLDVLTAGKATNTTSRLYLNLGAGIFDTNPNDGLIIEQYYNLESAQWITSCAAMADFDGDRDFDVALGRGDTGTSQQNIVAFSEDDAADKTCLATSTSDLDSFDAEMPVVDPSEPLSFRTIWDVECSDPQGSDTLSTTIAQVVYTVSSSNHNTTAALPFVEVKAWSTVKTNGGSGDFYNYHPIFIFAPNLQLPQFRPGMRMSVASDKYTSEGLAVEAIEGNTVRTSGIFFNGSTSGTVTITDQRSIDEFQWSLRLIDQSVQSAAKIYWAPALVDVDAGTLTFNVNIPLGSQTRAFTLLAATRSDMADRGLLDNTSFTVALYRMYSRGSQFPRPTTLIDPNNPASGTIPIPLLTKTTPLKLHVAGDRLRLRSQPVGASVSHKLEVVIECTDADGNLDRDIDSSTQTFTVTATRSGVDPSGYQKQVSVIAGCAYFTGDDAIIMPGTPEQAATLSFELTPPGGFTYPHPTVVSSAFPVTAAGTPTISAIVPDEALAAGGSTVFVTGTGLGGTSAVTFGGVNAASFVVISDNLIQAVVPIYTGAAIVNSTTVTLEVTGTATSDSADFSYYPCRIGPHPGFNVGKSQSIYTNTFNSNTTWISIRGEGLTSSTAITFGGQEGVIQQDQTIVTAISGSGDTAIKLKANSPLEHNRYRIVDVSASNAFGTYTLEQSYYYHALVAAPTISGLSSNTGSPAGGEQVTITGTNLYWRSSVQFGGLYAEVVAAADDHSWMTVITPAHAVGVVDIAITNSTKTTLAQAFTYDDGASPMLTSLSVTSGSVAGGETMTISGSRLSGTSLVVRFGSQNASIVSAGATSIQVRTPVALAAGAVDVSVSHSLGTSGVIAFTYVAHTVTSLSDASGLPVGGETIDIIGTGFSSGAQVFFGDTSASVTFVDATTLRVVTPASGSARKVDVAVKIGNVYVGLPAGYTYEGPQPEIQGVAFPNLPFGTFPSAVGGDVIEIRGVNLDWVDKVTLVGSLSGSPATKTWNFIGQEITRVAGNLRITSEKTSDLYTVSITVSDGLSTPDTLDAAFTFAVPTVTVQSMTPNTGHSGTSAAAPDVVIEATNADYVNTITFGSLRVFSKNGSYKFSQPTLSSIKFKAPRSDSIGTVDVTITRVAGTDANIFVGTFTYIDPNQPVITSYTPDHCPISATTSGGAPVILRLEGERLTQIVKVNILGVEHSEATNAFAAGWNDAQLEVMVSPAPNDVAETGRIEIVDAAGNTYDVGPFSYTEVEVSIDSMSPTRGSSSGGRVVEFVGSGLSAITGARFGSTPVSSIPPAGIDHSDTLLRLTAPAHIAQADVPVVLLAGTVEISAGLFTYAPFAPTVSSFTPTTAATGSSVQVRFVGSGLDLVTHVSFDDTPALLSGTPSDDTLNVFAPASSTAKTGVVITLSDGVVEHILSETFSYTSADIPMIDALSPDFGPTSGNTSVTITGSGFLDITEIHFGSTVVEVTPTQDDQMTVLTPAHAAGEVVVALSDGSTIYPSTVAYEYTDGTTASAPMITSVTPNHGPLHGGHEVYVQGTRLSTVTQVQFGTRDAVILEKASTYLYVRTPQGATAGPVSVRVSNGQDHDALSDAYTYEQRTGGGDGSGSSPVDPGILDTLALCSLNTAGGSMPLLLFVLALFVLRLRSSASLRYASTTPGRLRGATPLRLRGRLRE